MSYLFLTLHSETDVTCECGGCENMARICERQRHNGGFSINLWCIPCAITLFGRNIVVALLDCRHDGERKNDAGESPSARIPQA
jgi:hypothetical protein